MTRFQPISPATATAAALAAAVPPPPPRRLPQWTAMAAVLLAAPFALAGTAQAATITVGAEGTVGAVDVVDGDGTCSLIGAITNANADDQSGDIDCTAGSGTDTIVLPKGATFTLTKVNNGTAGENVNGLPVLVSAITIEGNGSTIQRSSATDTPRIRLIAMEESTAQVTLEDLILRGGDVAQSGAGVSAGRGSLTMRRCTVVGNTSSSSSAVVVSVGTALIEQSLITGNVARQQAGGLGVNLGATVTLRNSTITGNTGGNQGGGILLGSGVLTVENSTITGNSAVFYGGVYVSNGTLNLRNSIVAGNTATNAGTFKVHELGANAAQFIVSNNNVLGQSDRTFAAAFDQFTPSATDKIATSNGGSTGLHVPTALTSILDTSLASNGGPTQTHALVADSPAVNASGAGATEADQRGFVKAQGDTVRDIGAFELNGVAPPPPVVVVNGACGSASGNAGTATAPVDALCATGTASAVMGSDGAWRWSCNGSGGGTAATCAAPYAGQTITLTASPTSTTIGQEPANVGASSSSNRPATLSTTTPTICEVAKGFGQSGNVTAPIVGLAPGTCIVTATLAGTGDVGTFRYLAASDQTVDISVAKGVQKITAFSADKTQLPVGGMTTLSAEGGNSGNAVTFSSLSSEICFVSGSMVTALSAGTCTVAADQAGNDGYNDAAQATLDITVNKAAQLISGFTANPSALKVGGMATLSASGGASGNAIAFRTTTSEVCSVSGAMVTALSAGSCTLIASQAGNADFEAADEVSLTVAVNKAAQLISGFTANPTMIKVGQTSALSAFGGASGKPITFGSSTADTCSVSGSTVTALAIGNCVVTANQAGSADFEAAEPAMLTIGIEAADVVTAPVLALDMNDLDFGTGYLLRFRDIGVETTSEAEVVTLSNTGTAPLAISSIVTTGDFRHTTTCGVSVAPGATCTISIRFSPKAVGTRTGETRITSNAVTSPDLIRLSGTGKGLQPAIKTNVSSFDFGRVRVGATSRDQTLVISSTGAGPLEIRNITVSGDYSGSHNCPRWLDAGKSCQVTGRFRPRATGVRPGAVSILTSVSSTPTQVTLTGTGTSGGTVN